VEATSKWHARRKVIDTLIAAMEKRLGSKAPPRPERSESNGKDADLRAAMESLGGGGL
jgi:hypothetical protein